MILKGYNENVGHSRLFFQNNSEKKKNTTKEIHILFCPKNVLLFF